MLGHYKSERNELSVSARPVALRDHNHYSVILGVFRNEGYDQTVTLAQVFWIADAQGQPARFFAAAEGELSIAGEFAQFGSDITRLRKRLRGTGVEIWNTFPPYGAWFRRRFGIDNEQALDLFHQTVSMKSVGNLTEFVRGHMLEPFDVEPRIAALIKHFDDLSRAHEAVLRARRQIEDLTPLVADCERHAGLVAEVEELRQCREALRPFFAGLKRDLLDARIARLAEDWARQSTQIERTAERRDRERRDVEELKRAIAENGGDRLERLAGEILRLEREREARERKADRYAELARGVDETPAADDAAFIDQRARLADQAEELRSHEARLQNDLTELGVDLRQGKQERDALTGEIESLKARRSNISAQQIAMRAALCGALDFDEADMPFAGELLQVREEERDWEGAAERLLRSFGLSLLVPDECYAQVAGWVDAKHLGGRLVYFRVRGPGRRELPELHRDSLVRKLSVKPDSAFYDWLEHELARRFDVACCATAEQFRREARAITRAGQIKAPGERHEKDDRHRIDDRGRYVLGWTNAAKIAALESDARRLEVRLGDLGGRIGAMQAEQRGVREWLDTLSKLAELTDFRELDWSSLAAEVARLGDERRRLESAFDLLRQLNAQLAESRKVLEATEEALQAHRDRRSKTEQRRSDAETMRAETLSVLDGVDLAALAPRFDRLADLREEALGAHQLTIESCDNREQDMRQWLQGQIDAGDHRLGRLRDRIIRAMMTFKEQFPLKTAEFDANVEAGFEYREMLERLRADDLPRFESRFKELLNENTIREVANFQSQLARERETIKDRIARINASEDAVALIRMQSELAEFRRLVDRTRARQPALLAWVAKRPLRALELAGDWPRLLDVVGWLMDHPRPGVYLRQMDVPGVHSKFVEAHRGVLGELLDRALPPTSIDAGAPAGATGFARRYGFRGKPERIRFRMLDPAHALLPAAGEAAPEQDVTLDAASFAALDAGVSRVFITENEISFLAFPPVREGMVIFGAGYGFETLGRAHWLRRCRLHYWGDIDTHGFAILDALRARFDHAESFLMDRDTLMAFESLWGTEERPIDRDLPRLTAEERALYDDLRDRRIGRNLRLEQERIGFGWVASALGEAGET